MWLDRPRGFLPKRSIAGLAGRVHDAAMTGLQQLSISIPIVQAPMAGVATPELASAVSNAGA